MGKSSGRYALGAADCVSLRLSRLLKPRFLNLLVNTVRVFSKIVSINDRDCSIDANVARSKWGLVGQSQADSVVPTGETSRC